MACKVTTSLGEVTQGQLQVVVPAEVQQAVAGLHAQVSHLLLVSALPVQEVQVAPGGAHALFELAALFLA